MYITRHWQHSPFVNPSLWAPTQSGNFMLPFSPQIYAAQLYARSQNAHHRPSPVNQVSESKPATHQRSHSIDQPESLLCSLIFPIPSPKCKNTPLAAGLRTQRKPLVTANPAVRVREHKKPLVGRSVARSHANKHESARTQSVALVRTLSTGSDGVWPNRAERRMPNHQYPPQNPSISIKYSKVALSIPPRGTRPWRIEVEDDFNQFYPNQSRHASQSSVFGTLPT